MPDIAPLNIEDIKQRLLEALPAVEPNKQKWEKLAEKQNAECDLENKRIDLDIKRDKRTKRIQLSWWLLGTAVGWLVFSAVVIVLIGCHVLEFTEFGVVTFIAGSLAEVFGLWKIALQYFFSDK